ncbi:MAG TPA: peptide ABC transporter substrate-binding protein [Bacteroidia bacterium]|nr:peptide ABC transporter substrate-binding protein [Bacteroidia bacterium]
MKKYLLFLPIVFFAASCGTDPGGNDRVAVGKGDYQPVYGGTLRYNETDKLQTLCPAQITDAISNHVATQIYEGLVKFDPRTLEIMDGIADDWSVDESGTTYTFKIRSDVKFHDDACFPEGKGRALTAQDVLYSFELLCTDNKKNENFGTTFSHRVVGADAFFAAGTGAKPGSLEGVKVVDDKTITITLVSPSNSFLYVLANSAASIVPKEAVEKYGDQMHVGTGPFVFASIAADTSEVILVRNANYYGKDTLGNQLPFLDTVKISFIDNKVAELDLFQDGKLDFVWGLNADAVKTFVPQVIQDFTAKPPKYVLYHSSELVTQIYEFNTTRPPFDDVRVRKAFCYAVDRKYIVDEVLAGEAYGPGINGICPPALPGYKASEIVGYEKVGESDAITKENKIAERAMAKKLLAEAGFPDGKGFPTVKLVLNSGGSRNTRVAEAISSQLKEVLNINVEIANVSFQQKLNDAKFARSDIYRSAWVADYPSAETFLSLFYGADVPDSTSQPSFPNTSRYRNPKFDSLFTAAREAKTIDEANKLFMQAEQVMINDAPAMILWYDENYRLAQSRVRNFWANPMRYFDFSQVYLKEVKAPDEKKDSTDREKKSETKFIERRKFA